ncbi:MAG: hypothetical protein QW707_03230 [Candidatus Bathyarchaeia archaeon]
MPSLRIVTLPSETWYSARNSISKVIKLVQDDFDDIVRALTEPLSYRELETKDKIEQEDELIEIIGESYEDVLEKFNELFLQRKWGDGLPLIPPTPNRLEWILRGTIRKPDEILGTIAPRDGIATVRKIAINSVMAGAKPEYLRVILTVMEILADKEFDDRHVLQSAGGFSLMIVISGPIYRELCVNAGIGFLGHGWRANSTIGRAVRLSTLNIGHSWPGENDMAIIGRPSSHTFNVFAENLDENPWPPYHVRYGFKENDNTVTVFTFGTHYGIGGAVGYGGGIMGYSAGEIMGRIVEDIINDRKFFKEWDPKGMRPGDPGHGKGPRKHMIILFPAVVKELSKLFRDQNEFASAIYDRARVPYEELSAEERQAIRSAIEEGIIPSERIEVFNEALKPGGRVPVLVSPEDIHVFVAGGTPGFAFGVSYYRLPPYNNTAIMTKLLSL